MHNWQSTVEEYKGSSIEQPFLSHKLNDLLNGNHEKSKTFQDLKTNLPHHIYKFTWCVRACVRASVRRDSSAF